jgi:ligand-binding sensor domain-containing protein/signal transduction histidine kinase
MSLSPLKLKKWFCRLLFLSLLPLSTGGRAEQLPIKSYTSADGLPRDYINRIVLDSHGFLWFCTPEGLSRFDGYSFVNYGSEQGLPSGAVWDLLVTRDGTYWIATPNGVCHFNLFAATEASASDNEQSNNRAFGILASSPRFACYRPEGKERGQTVYKLKEDRNGKLWVGTNGGLFHLEPANDGWVFRAAEIGIPAVPPDSATISTILEDRSGALWIGAGSGLYRRQPDGHAERYTTAEGLPGNDVRALLEDRDGRIWAGTTQGLCELVSQPESHRLVVSQIYTIKNGLANNYITALHQFEGRIWIGSDAGLTEFAPATGNAPDRFRIYTTAQGLTDREIESFGEDKDGNLWIGTESNGAMKLARHGLNTYREADGLKDSRIASIIEDASGELCVISSRSGKLFMHRFDGTKFTAITPNLREDIKHSWGWNQITFQDRTRQWWVDTAEGLYRFPSANGVEQLGKLRPAALYTTKDGLSGNEIFRLYEDRAGDLWISIADSLTANLARWERATGKIYQYGGIEALAAPNAPTAFREDNDGNLWIGLYYGGLVRFRAGQFTGFTGADGVPPGLIRDLYVDHNGKLWIATVGGGVTWTNNPSAERPRFSSYTTSEGLASNKTTCITEDQYGRIYIGSVHGVDRLDPLTGKIKHYTEADGLANNFVNVAHRDRGGALWFGTLKGLSQLMPEEDHPVSPPTILISKVRIAGVEEGLSNLSDKDAPSLVLGPDRNQVQIDFVGLGFGTGETLRYQTKLEGADKAWTEPSLQRSVNYAQLAPGTYRFRVRAISSGGTMSSHTATISFRILAPIWQRWWFITLVALMVAALAYVLYKYRVNQLLQLERMRTRIASDLHDDIGSNLSLIAGLSEVLGQSAGRENSQIADRLSVIANASRQSVESMGEIVWAVNPKRDNVVDLAHRMRRFASDVLTARNIEFHFDAPSLNQNAKLGAESRREIFLIFKEGINNIARHSGCKTVAALLKIERGMIILKLSDDGHGFEAANVEQGHGLDSMRRRAEKLDGQFELTSSLGAGTKMTLSVPLGRHG